jgi:hypothetical protein
LFENVPDKPAVYVLGDHERYGAKISIVPLKRTALAERTNDHVLENELVEIDGVEFAGGTLWTEFALFGSDRNNCMHEGCPKGAERFQAHSLRTDRRMPEDALARHEATIGFLRSRASEATRAVG